jgi:hypothetical protein
MKRPAIRSVWKIDLPPAVALVTKKVRECPLALFGSDGREGFDIAGAEALRGLQAHAARLKSFPDTLQQHKIDTVRLKVT